MDGYIWNTVEKRSTHKTRIERGSKTLKQPKKELAREVQEKLKTLKVYIHDKSPLVEYLRDKRKILTLLKLTDLEELAGPLKLEDFKLLDGTPIHQPPQGYYRIILP